MLSYLAFIHQGITVAGDDPFIDGKTLAESCVNQLEELNDADQFPPRLLILLVSPAYLDTLKAEQLLSGVFQVFDDAGHRGVPLMGCSVAAVFFDKHVHRKGALLMCIASRLLEAKVRVSPEAIKHHEMGYEKVIKKLLDRLKLLENDGKMNDKPRQSFANRTLFALFPGFGQNQYAAPELHAELRKQLGGRVSIFGGAASADDPQRIRPGILFANRTVQRNAIVAASVESGTPFGISLTQGLTDKDKELTYTVDEVDPNDPCVVRSFKEGSALSVFRKLEDYSRVPLLANLELDRDPIVDLPLLEEETGTIRLARKAAKDELFRLMIPEPKRMLSEFRKGVSQSLDKAWLLNPIGGLGFRCAGLLRHSDRIGVNLDRETELIEYDLSKRETAFNKPFVGGFVDGEASIDENGKSVLANWSNATLAFGDELRFRTPVYRGFEKLALFAAEKVAGTYGEAVERLTQLVYDIGFPGAMLSLWLNDDDRETIVVQSAHGSRFRRVLKTEKTYPVDDREILAMVARQKQPLPVIDSRLMDCGSMNAARKEGIISQYIVPLLGAHDDVVALLQIGLGDISYDTGLYPSEKRVLDDLGKIVKSGLNRAFSREGTRIISDLDQAMSDCLSATTIKQGLQRYLKAALEAFGLTKGHIRIAQEDEHRLKLVTGTGDYFEETRNNRQYIDFGDLSPTAEAFRKEKIIIINDARNNRAHQEMCERWETVQALYEQLQEIGSYANIYFESDERKERGTINLVSAEPWFFNPCHQYALEALGKRVGFLLETLRRKERESFLIGVSPQFSELRDLDNARGVLENEINRFAQTAKADIASLYLWDNYRQRFILRAQYGWADSEWLNSAYYKDNEKWTGATALSGKPRHIPDLHSYYEENPLRDRRYGKEAFGQELSDTFTVEALGVQLRVAKQRLGVLTLYRHIKPGAESGFFTTDPELLQQGADGLASLIAILQANRRETWRKDEHNRRQAVYDATLFDSGSFESRVCAQALESYRAVKARFYQVEFVDDGTPCWELRKSLERGRSGPPSPDEEDLVREAVLGNRGKERKIVTERVILRPEERLDPKRVALSDLVNRACIPLVSEKKLVGLLDLHWSLEHLGGRYHSAPIDDQRMFQINDLDGEGLPSDSAGSEHKLADRDFVFPEALGAERHHSFKVVCLDRDAGSTLWERVAYEQRVHKSPDYEHVESHLLMLGAIVGAAYRRNQTKDSIKQSVEMLDLSGQAGRITSVYVMQHQHDLGKIVGNMIILLNSLKEAFTDGSDEAKTRTIEALSQHCTQSSGILTRIVDVGSRVVEQADEHVSVKGMVAAALEDKAQRLEKWQVEVLPAEIPSKLSTYVDPSLIDIVLANLIDNAVNAMIGRSERYLKIRATANADRESITIAISDTGKGMTPEKLAQLERGFFQSNGHISLGVPICKMILGLYHGRLNYSSFPDSGTETRIVLPINYRE